MSLPTNDTAYLAERKIDHSVTISSGMICVVLPRFLLPGNLVPSQADLLMRLHPGYPDVPPDMWWFDPAVRRADGRPIAATEVVEVHLERSWQRWSRHFQPGQWRSGVDGIESFIALIRKELERCAAQAAA